MSPSNRPQDIIRRNRRTSIPSVLQFPATLGPHSMLLIFSKYQYVKPGERELNKVDSNTFTSQNLVNKEAILLPLPANIEDTYNIRVQGYEAGLSGSLVAGAASNFAGAGDLSAGNLTSAIGGALSGTGFSIDSLLSSNMSDVSRNVAFLGRRAIDETIPNAGRNIDAGLGNTINPKASLYFDGVNLKQLNFNWTLAPQEETESDTIRDISDCIKRNSLPSYGNAVGFSRSLLNYPSVVDIFFLGIQQDYFVYYKTCMIQSFTTNFTPQGLTFVRGGKPAIVTMNIGMIESDIHTSEDYGGSSSDNPSIVSLPQSSAI